MAREPADRAVRWRAARCRLIPPAWSLAVEMIFLFPALARHRSLGAGRSCSVCCFRSASPPDSIVEEADFGTRYYTVAASALPFCVGASLFFVKDALRRPAARHASWVGHAGTITSPTLSWPRFCWSDVFLWPFYINVALAALTVVALHRCTRESRASGSMAGQPLLSHVPVPLARRLPARIAGSRGRRIPWLSCSWRCRSPCGFRA